MVKKRLLPLLPHWLLCFAVILTGCNAAATPVSDDASLSPVDDHTLTVVATLFPQYDFARQIAGDKAQVQLLLPPGADSHTYEPTPQDVVSIAQSQLFLYTGSAMEPWAASLLESSNKDMSQVCDVSLGIPLSSQPPAVTVSPNTHGENHGLDDGDVHDDGHTQDDAGVHDDGHTQDDGGVHDDGHTQDDGDVHDDGHTQDDGGVNDDGHTQDDGGVHDDGHTQDDGGVHNDGEIHSHDLDPHIWTSPVFARQMAQNIYQALTTADPQNASAYRENWQKLDSDLIALDQDFRTLAADHPGQVMVFGSPFAAGYFVQEYGFQWASPYAYCGHGSEPSPQEIVLTADLLAEQSQPMVFYQEPSPGKICENVAQESGGTLVLFHTCHNVSQQEIDAGATYLSLMRDNLSRLRQAFSAA